MDISQSSNRIVNAFPPLNNITPFTRVDGWSFLEVLEGLRNYIVNTLVGEIDSKNDAIVEQLNKWFDDYTRDFADLKTGWQGLFDDFMLNVIERLEGLNDQAVANLVRNAQSEISKALREVYVEKGVTVDYWVNPATGNDTNIGTNSAPFKTIARAIELSKNKVLEHNAIVNIRLFPLVYTERVIIPHTSTKFVVNFIGHPVGGHPNVPQTLWWHGGSHDGQAFTGTSVNADWTLNDIKFIDFDGGTSAGGASNTEGKCTMINVHATNCYFGGRSQHGNIVVKGGIYTNCTMGINSYMVNRHEIGDQGAGVWTKGPFFINCGKGVSIHEATSGHVDYCLFDGCETGLFVGRNATLNPTGSKFIRNGIAISAVNGANFFTSENVFGVGVEANDTGLTARSGSFISSDIMWTSIVTTGSLSDYMVRDINEESMHGGSANYFTYLGSGDLQPAWWNDISNGQRPDKAYITKITGEIISSPGFTRFTQMLGSNEDFPYVDVTAPDFAVGSFVYESEITFRDRGKQIIKSTLLVNGQPAIIKIIRGNADMSSSKVARVRMRLYGGNELTSSVRVDSVQNWMR